MASLLGVGASTGFIAGVRARAARLLEAVFLPRVRELLASVGVLHVDETPGRADGDLSYVHVACTEFLTVMHTGGRSAADIDAGGVLPGYTGTIVRDGYAGYTHLIGPTTRGGELSMRKPGLCGTGWLVDRFRLRRGAARPLRR
jgi:transposase